MRRPLAAVTGERHMVGGVRVGGYDADGILSVGLPDICGQIVHRLCGPRYGEGAVDEIVLRIDDEEHFPEAGHHFVDFTAHFFVSFGIDGRHDHVFCEIDHSPRRSRAEEERIETVRAETGTVESVGVLEHGVELFDAWGVGSEVFPDSLDAQIVVEIVIANQESGLGVKDNFGVGETVLFIVSGGACAVSFVVSFVDPPGVVKDRSLGKNLESLGVVAEDLAADGECEQKHAAAVTDSVYLAVGTVEDHFPV